MKRGTAACWVCWATALEASLSASVGAEGPVQEAGGLRATLGYVVVTPDGPGDSGDFGRNTPGTKTGGIQEAIDAAVAGRKNVFIAGTQGKEAKDVYNTSETIRVPPTQGFRIDGGHYVINYTQASGDALRIDSCMDADYRFGLIVSRSRDAVVRLRPERPVPIDKMVVITDSSFAFSSVVGGGVFDLTSLRITEPPRGGGIVLDASKGPIVWTRVYANSVLLCEKGVWLTTGGTKNSVSNNWVHVLHDHQCRTGLQLGDAGDPADRVTFNRIDLSLHGEGIAGSIGARIFGRQNLLSLDVQSAAAGKDVVFEEDAADNIVYGLNLPNGITNEAKRGTNRVILAKAVGFGVVTPEVPASGQAVMNRDPYPVVVMIVEPGEVSGWSLTDATGTEQGVKGGFAAGQWVPLQPGEKIRLTYAKAPVWRWKADE